MALGLLYDLLLTGSAVRCQETSAFFFRLFIPNLASVLQGGTRLDLTEGILRLKAARRPCSVRPRGGHPRPKRDLWYPPLRFVRVPFATVDFLVAMELGRGEEDGRFAAWLECRSTQTAPSQSVSRCVTARQGRLGCESRGPLSFTKPTQDGRGRDERSGNARASRKP